MRNTVLVPLDGSEAAERAVPLAAAVAARDEATLRLIHVHVPLTDQFAAGVPVSAYRDEFRSMDDAESYMNGMLDRLRGTGVVLVTADVLRGEVLDTLLHELLKRDVHRVVMTTHGRGGISSALMGSVATPLVRESHVPVLLCGPLLNRWASLRVSGMSLPRVGIEHVMVALDGSAAAEAVVPHAMDLAGLFGARVTLLAVSPQSELGTSYAGVPMSAPLEASSREVELDPYLDRSIERFGRPGIPMNRRLVRSDEVAAAINRAAGEESADVIAMTTHARGPARRVLLGSVAAAVVRSATLPVLLYRPDFAA